MKTQFALSFAVLTFASLAHANCSDNLVAKCGDFQIESTICNDMDGGIASSRISAVYSDADVGEVLLTPTKNAGEYRGVVSSEQDVYVLENTVGYQYYTTDSGKKSAVKSCALLSY